VTAGGALNGSAVGRECEELNADGEDREGVVVDLQPVSHSVGRDGKNDCSEPGDPWFVGKQEAPRLPDNRNGGDGECTGEAEPDQRGRTPSLESVKQKRIEGRVEAYKSRECGAPALDFDAVLVLLEIRCIG
jgi:hypothetical protein